MNNDENSSVSCQCGTIICLGKKKENCFFIKFHFIHFLNTIYTSNCRAQNSL